VNGCVIDLISTVALARWIISEQNEKPFETVSDVVGTTRHRAEAAVLIGK
jgi:hypothetical protein